jgi:hypothetical protein
MASIFAAMKCWKAYGQLCLNTGLVFAAFTLCTLLPAFAVSTDEKTPIASFAWQRVPVENGLQLVGVNDSKQIAPVSKDGRQGFQCVGPAVGRFKYMQFRLTDNAFRNGRRPKVQIHVDYFDEGQGPISIEYDSQGGTKSWGLDRLQASETWTSGSANISDAQFAGRDGGSDFRLVFPNNVNPIVASVSVEPWQCPSDMQVAKPAWKIEETTYPTNDVVVAGYNVREFGAKGDGTADDTIAIQSALIAMAKYGGGTVFVPAGRYALRGHLTIPSGVTLRGDWMKPAPGHSVGGTILMAYEGRGQKNGTPFMTLGYNSGILGCAVWYPDQIAGSIAPYPFTINFKGGDNPAIKNVTLVNSYLGINLGPGFMGCPFVKDVYGSPLGVGMLIENTADVGRFEDICFDPSVWTDSGLPGAPPSDGPHAKWMHENGTGIRLFRVDGFCGDFINVRGYQVGIDLKPSAFGVPDGHLYACNVTDCQTALRVEDTHPCGWMLTRCTFDGDIGIHTLPSFSAAMMCHTCKIHGQKAAAELDGNGWTATLFQSCSFEGTVIRKCDNASFVDCSYESAGDQLVLENRVNAAIIAGSHFIGGQRVVNRSNSKNIVFTDQAIPSSPLPEVNYSDERQCKPRGKELFVATDKAYGATGDGNTDDTAAIQKALNTAASRGGGIVFLPSGLFCIHGSLSVPPGVELRGIYDVPHQLSGAGSTLKLFAGRGKTDAPPAIALSGNCGIRGITFFYPDQNPHSIVPYPPTIQGRGPNIYAIYTSGRDPFCFVDLASRRCDKHYIDGLFGAPLNCGVKVGSGAEDGEVRNCHFNPMSWIVAPYAANKITDKNTMDLLGNYMGNHLDAFVFGNCKNEFGFDDFSCMENIGFRFMSGASGVFLTPWCDGSKIACEFDGVGSAGLSLIGMRCASGTAFAYTTRTCTSNVKLFNSGCMGNAPSLAHVAPAFSALTSGGQLDFELAHFCKYSSFRADAGAILLTNAFLDNNTTGNPEFMIYDTGTEKTSCCLLRDAQNVGKPLTGMFNCHYAPPLPADTNQAFAILGRVPVFQGITIPAHKDHNDYSPVNIKGRNGWQGSGTATFHPGLYYMSVFVDQPSFKNGRLSRAAISIDYFDQGHGFFLIDYDSKDGLYTHAGGFKLTDSKSWKTFNCTVNNALFVSRLSGADLRLDIRSDVPPIVAAVRIGKVMANAGH